MKTTLFRLFVVVLLGLAAPLRAAEDPRLEKLRAADDDRVDAVLAGDTARLAGIFTDDLRYAHSSGTIDDKRSLLDALSTGRIKYLAWSYEERNFSFPAPTIALMTGRTRIVVGRPESRTELLLGFLAVWKEEGGAWRFVSWQSCKLPEPAPVAK